ncbi:hypothetical protein DS909_10915 [Phaeobacter gallaeciensis]|uniref:Uncharacterized protein n=2 Tax=Roseobacteraceae TaxID=2854170 RepID=A0A366X0W3_9RHOB|nr:MULTISPECIES: hypothetical protein [Roseobacteraceae]MBT3143437.1 hypothetical protein [Falsiruegeria litorea]MBT8167723.1 hypothetical protein [Falsiruegeria litorea]RBW55603.1 hypothetical protein DS909_10915 [Phaeobacter gallaeciensis]
MAATDFPTRPPLLNRLVFAIPLFGWMAKEMAEGGADIWFFAIAAVVCMWGCSTLLFGLPGFYLPAVLFVPVMFLILILISRGK